MPSPWDRMPGQSQQNWMGQINSSMAPTASDDFQMKVPPPSWVMEQPGYRGGIGTAPSAMQSIRQTQWGGAKPSPTQLQPRPPLRMPYQRPHPGMGIGPSFTPGRGGLFGMANYGGGGGMGGGYGINTGGFMRNRMGGSSGIM